MKCDEAWGASPAPSGKYDTLRSPASAKIRSRTPAGSSPRSPRLTRRREARGSNGSVGYPLLQLLDEVLDQDEVGGRSLLITDPQHHEALIVGAHVVQRVTVSGPADIATTMCDSLLARHIRTSHRRWQFQPNAYHAPAVPARSQHGVSPPMGQTPFSDHPSRADRCSSA